MPPGGSIDNSRPGCSNHTLDQCLRLIGCRVKCFHTEPDVGPIKTLHDDLRIAHFKPFHNLFTYFWCSGGSESQYSWASHLLEDSPKPQVFRSETIPPLADTMCFINDKQSRVCSFQLPKDLLIIELLRGKKQKVEFAFLQVLKDFLSFGITYRRVHLRSLPYL